MKNQVEMKNLGCSKLGHSVKHGTLPDNSLLGEQKLSVKEAATRMGIGATSLRRLINSGEIPVIHIGGKLLVLARDMEAFLRGCYVRVETVGHEGRRKGVPESVRTASVLSKG